MNELSAEVRRNVSKSGRSALRKAGRVPAILYGKGRDPLPLSVEQKELVVVRVVHRELERVQARVEAAAGALGRCDGSVGGEERVLDAAALGERFYAQRSRDFGATIAEYFSEWEIAKQRCPTQVQDLAAA